jgi:hypothetical protein
MMSSDLMHVRGILLIDYYSLLSFYQLHDNYTPYPTTYPLLWTIVRRNNMRRNKESMASTHTF